MNEFINETNELNNYKEMLESLVLDITKLSDEGSYVSLIDLIDSKLDLLENKDKVNVLNSKIKALYKTNDYNGIIKTAKVKRLIDESINDKAFTLFYESIAYEALNEIDHAIDSLNDILDNVSKTDLINKYLKLSMLYIKVNNIEKAKECFSYASKVDYLRKNPMFDLVESDLEYALSSYTNSLSLYEKFFLKSPNKHKYLDRYILINIKLNNLEEAYKFYLNYKDKVIGSLNNQYLISFYNASLELNKLLDNQVEIDYLNSKLDELNNKYYDKNNETKIEYIKSLIEYESYPLTKYDKRKNIFFRLSRIIEKILPNNFYFIEDNKDGISFTYLEEKESRTNTFKYTSLKEMNILDDFIFEEDIVVDHFYDFKLNRIDNNFKVYTIKNNYYNYGYFVVLFNKEEDDIYNIFRLALLEIFNKLDYITKSNDSFNALLDSLNNIELGFIKLTSNNVELYNSYARDIFNINKEIIDFYKFKELFIKDIYVDSFINKEKLTFNLMIDNQKRIIEFTPIMIDNTLYSFVKDVTLTIKETEHKEDFYLNSDIKFYNINKLKDIINSKLDSFALIGLNIKFLDSGYTLNKRTELLNIFYDYLAKESSSKDIFYLGENNYLLLIDTVDKRNIESIYNKIEKNIFYMYKYNPKLRDHKISGFATKSLKNKDFDKVNDLLEYGFSYSSRINEFIILDNDNKKGYQMYNLFSYEVEKRIKNNELSLVYLPLVKESTKEIIYLYPSYASIYDYSYDAIMNVIHDKALEIDSDLMIINKIISNKKNLSFKFNYIISIHDESLYSKAFINKVISLIKDNGLEKVITLYINTNNIKAINELYDNGIRLATKLKSIVKEDMDKYSVLFVDVNDENEFNDDLLKLIETKLYKSVVIDSLNNIYKDFVSIKRRNPFTIEDLKKF